MSMRTGPRPRSRTDSLPVRLGGRLIGELRPGGVFSWVDGWEQIAPLNAPVLSQSIPFGDTRALVAPFFGGLLPEGIGLERLARETQVPSNDLYGMLAEVGADVGGAVTIGEPRPPLEPISLASEEYGRLLDEAVGYIRGSAVGGGGSAATGVQAKVALTRDPLTGAWAYGRGSTPSTHILKPVDQRFGDAVRSEAYLNAVARELGLSAHDAWVEDAGERLVLVVERYDRRVEAGVIVRVHQEDAAQALGLPWGADDKYESVNPEASLRNIAALLRGPENLFDSGVSDRDRLLSLTVLNVVAGNTDAHAKNFSMILPDLDVAFAQEGRRVRLADAYDLVPQALGSAEVSPLAMRIAGRRILAEVTAEDLIAEGKSWGLSHARATNTVRAALGRILGSIDRLGSMHRAPAKLHAYVREQAENLERGDRAWTRALPPALAVDG